MTKRKKEKQPEVVDEQKQLEQDFQDFLVVHGSPHPQQCMDFRGTERCTFYGEYIDAETASVACAEHATGFSWPFKTEIFPLEPVAAHVVWQHSNLRIVHRLDWSPRYWTDANKKLHNVTEPYFNLVTLEKLDGKDVLGVERWHEVVSGALVGLMPANINEEKEEILLFVRAIVLGVLEYDFRNQKS